MRGANRRQVGEIEKVGISLKERKCGKVIVGYRTIAEKVKMVRDRRGR